MLWYRLAFSFTINRYLCFKFRELLLTKKNFPTYLQPFCIYWLRLADNYVYDFEKPFSKLQN